MRLAVRLAMLAAMLLPTAGVQAAETSVSRVPPLPSAKVELSDGVDGPVLRIDGVITPQVARDFEEALSSLPPGAPLLLELDSPGGYTSAGYAMIDRLMAERAAGRHVATLVRADDSCESMCVGLFMAGEARYAAATAQFMVHAPRGLNSGTVTVRSTGRMINRLIDLGASAAWIEQVKEAGGFSGKADYRTSAAQLAQDRANIVTMILE